MSTRRRLPTLRQSLTLKNAVGQLEFYVTVSFYDDEPLAPGELFVHVAKEGSTLGGLCSSLALVLSLALQHQAPWPELSRHFRGACFDPSGNSLDGTKVYRSIAEAIVDTVDMIIEQRRREFDRQTLSTTLAPTLAQSANEPQTPTTDPSRDADGSGSLVLLPPLAASNVTSPPRRRPAAEPSRSQGLP